MVRRFILRFAHVREWEEPFTATQLPMILAVLLLLIASGCASLPRKTDFMCDPRQRAPIRLLCATGELSSEQCKTMIREAAGGEHGEDFIRYQASLIESFGGSPLVSGNKVTLLLDGQAAYDAMFEAIDRAVDHINMETYMIEDDEIGRKFADLLIKKRKQGVVVNLIYDSYGCLDTPRSFFLRMEDSGIRTLEFNPLNPFKSRKTWSLNHRDHRKLLIIDGRVAFTGSVNITRLNCRYIVAKSERPHALGHWHDLHARIAGPAVAEFQKLFLEAWERGNAPPLQQATYFPPPIEESGDLVQVVSSKPGKMARLTYMMYCSAVSRAARSIRMTTPYFVLDEQMLDSLCGAAMRGVDVRIILPEASDCALAYYAAHHHFGRLLRAGVKLFEYKGAMIHRKTAVVDGVWTTVGSSNLDIRSFLINDELNAVVVGKDFAAQMEAVFEQDLKSSQPVHLEAWEKRPVKRRIREWLANWFSYWL